MKNSNQSTAIKALNILTKSDSSYKILSREQKQNLLVAFAKKKKIIYGQAFDIIRIDQMVSINFDDPSDIEKNLKNIILCEVKSTKKKELGKGFRKYFFSISTAELLVAQSLTNQYKFIFVNTNSKEIDVLDLADIFQKAIKIYPSWSIQF